MDLDPVITRSIELCPNCALSPRQARLFFLSVAGPALLFALLFASHGLWPVLPFAGLELGVLGWALWASLLRRHLRQRLAITERDVSISTRDATGERQMVFSRHWARVTLRGPRGWLPSRLYIESHGRACEVGAFLTEAQRQALFVRLSRLIGPGGSSPPLASGCEGNGLALVSATGGKGAVMLNANGKKWALAIIGALLALPAGAYESSFNLPRGVTPVSREVFRLHMLIFWICVIIGVVVFGAMIYSLVNFRRSRGAVADQSFTHSTKIEIIWTILPFFILVGMAIPAARTLLVMEDTRGSELSIKVTGYQWQWQYEYLGQGVSFYSRLAEDSNEARQLDSGIDPRTVKDYLLNVDNPLVVPVDTKVRVLITGNDVIHAWWVPDFAVKKDAIPGFVNEAWFTAEKTGRYTGQCAELCGRDHGFMPIVVEVVSKSDFAKWLADSKAAGHPAPLPAVAANPAPAAVAASASN